MDKKVKSLEAQLKDAVARINELEGELKLVKNQIIEQSVNVNSVILNNTAPSLDFQSSETANDMLKRIEYLENSLRDIINKPKHATVSNSNEKNIVDSLVRSNTTFIEINPTVTSRPEPIGPACITSPTTTVASFDNEAHRKENFLDPSAEIEDNETHALPQSTTPLITEPVITKPTTTQHNNLTKEMVPRFFSNHTHVCYCAYLCVD